MFKNNSNFKKWFKFSPTIIDNNDWVGMKTGIKQLFSLSPKMASSFKHKASISAMMPRDGKANICEERPTNFWVHVWHEKPNPSKCERKPADEVVELHCIFKIDFPTPYRLNLEFGETGCARMEYYDEIMSHAIVEDMRI
jgi:hypothetical protein